MADPGSTSNPDEPGQRDAEGSASAFDPDSWFESRPGSAPLSEDFVDQDLSRLSSRPSVLQLLLVLVVMGFAAFVGWTLRADLAYFFAETEPLELGAVEDMAADLASDPNALDSLESNTFVRIQGIPQRRAVAGDRQWAQLVGAPIFIESPREDLGSDPIMRDVRFRVAPNEEPLRRYYLEVEGRLLRFADLGRRYRGHIDFYRDGYNMWFCGEPLTRSQEDFRLLTVDELRDELGREPTDDEIGRAFRCQNGFLVQDGIQPRDQVWQLVAILFIALIELAGLWYAIRWTLRLRASLKA